MEASEKEEISVEDEAIDKNIFRDCNKIAFYRRQKQWLSKKSTYQALLESVTTDEDSTRFQIINEASKVRCQDQSPTTLDAFKGKETTVQEETQDLSTRQYLAQKEAEEPDKQGKITWDISNVAPKTENFEDLLEQNPCSACLQGFTRDNTSSSFSKDAGISLSTSMKLPLASSSKPNENEALPNQPPSQQTRHNYHLLASTVSAEMARNRQLIWELARQSEAHLDRPIVLGEQATAQHEVASILCRKSVLAVNQLAATVEGTISVLQQFNELLDHSLDPRRS
ncbi:neutral alpha-glucosidase C isoform X4 [Nomascus leucogenys]|uniref:Glucosidase alpha, neutral C n=1 Tax=Nomascus leucogenys TaxID=61853 RepID=A0A2I3HNQ1_NOMLE|nr:neutral alpha-glucosidase C isoform X4 [Nomascus leucogenys]XP_030670103.1 neutral alpha-glucosidase C isoform X4 [Nomascus leucogenys]XP_030670104.1 neutral alpha-glucosidase C isoform X4 [Nomascus leucogenys]